MMNKKLTVSAPGKLMLLGEHAVVYDRPCLVTAVSQRMRVMTELINEPTLLLDAPDVNVVGYKKLLSELGKGEIPKGAQFVEIAVKNFLDKYPFKQGINITTQSEFSSQFGFGSSSASIVCVLKALSEATNSKLTNEQLFDLAYKTVLDIQGKGSGFDVAAAIFGGTLYFTTGGRIIEPVNTADIPLIVGYTGIKADTKTMIFEIEEKKKTYPEKINRIYDAIAKITEEARQKILEGDWKRVGKLMDFNQEYLRDLGVSSEKLEALISAAKRADAWGAKLSGAGRGDCMIALASSEKRNAVSNAIKKAGGEVVPVTPNAPGVRVETTDNQDEVFVVVDRDDNVLGYKTRWECHHDPSLIHRTVGALIFNDKGQLLLQKRSMTKDMEAGLWGISAAGHVTRGQTDEEAVHLELQEELGVDMPLTFWKKFISEEPDETERDVAYKGMSNGPFHPNAEEVAEVRFFEICELKLHIASRRIQLTEGAIKTLQEVKIL
ncbi:mevalonate kinase [Patescibacteria group bacterium]|nr:mevalonate kinase [Patescibacteria group bacterium]MBU1472201.1 mevalonate kinase [Patescibacteria group bacterium]MBU2459595.1 mevalonate kinase [Patescibacteria group bacterium]MBU2544164.1 mevalonate kinase [Patescibacteria group bacterium]